MDQDELYFAIHELWTWAVGKEGYDKRKWQRVVALVEDLQKRSLYTASDTETLRLALEQAINDLQSIKKLL